MDDNFGIDDIKLDNEKAMNDQIQAQKNTRASNSTFENSSNNDGGFSLNKQNFDLNKAAHPVACVFTFAFKVASVVMYFIGEAFFSQTFTFIMVILCGAFDFWTVKNITGRLLLGFRWSAEYNQKGQSVMKYQTYDKQYKPNPVDAAFFWASQLGFSVFWAILLLIKTISFQFITNFIWYLCICLSLFITFSNLYAFYQCRKEYNAKLQKFIKGKLAEGMIKNVMGNL